MPNSDGTLTVSEMDALDEAQLEQESKNGRILCDVHLRRKHPKLEAVLDSAGGIGSFRIDAEGSTWFLFIKTNDGWYRARLEKVF